MAKIRRIIHSVEKPKPTGLDAQYWPVLIAIAVLFGFLMGAVLTLLSGIWLWFSLLAIPVLVVSTTIGLRFVDNQRFKRTSQLALIVSLIVHLAMLITAHHLELFGGISESTDQITEEKKVTQKKETLIPIIFDKQSWQQAEQTITPQPDEKKTEQKKQETQREVETKETPTPIDKSQRKVTQNQNRLRKPAETIPKQSTTLSKLSRSKLETQPKSGLKVSKSETNSPAANPSSETSTPSQLTAKNNPQPKKTSSESQKANPTKVAIKTPSQKAAEAKTIQRRDVTEPQPSTTQAKSNSRPRRSRTFNANPANPTEIVKTNPAKSAPTNQPTKSAPKPTLSPSRADVAKAAPNRATEQPTQKSPDQSDAQRQNVTEAVASRRPKSESNPQIAKSPASRSRSTSRVQTPNTTVMESPQRLAQAPKESSQLNPRPTTNNIARQKNVTARPTQIQVEAPTQQTSQLTQSATRANRRPNQTLPSINPNATPDAQPRRSTKNSPQLASNTTAESPSKNTSQTQLAKSEGQPRSTTLQKSTKGTAGTGQSQNVLSDAPTSAKPSMIASDSAVRRQTTRNSPTDTAFSPVQAAKTRRSLADQNSPSAQMKVENVSEAQFAGSSTPTQLNAQSSASQITAASNAEMGRINASQGSSTLDTGATKLVSESGSSRASGGGQPDIDKEIRSSSSQRSRNGQVNNSSLAANLKADIPTSPEETGGGKPSETILNPNASSLAKTLAGSGNQALAGPTSAATAGPMEDSSSAPSAAATTIARAAPNDSAEGKLTQGGGDPNQNSTLRRVRSQLAGGSANTKVTFSGEVYTSEEEGSDGGDTASAAALVGNDSASIESQLGANSGTIGSGVSAEMMADAVAEKLAGEVSGGGITRQKVDGQGVGNDVGIIGTQIARSRSNTTRQGGPLGPAANARVELPSGEAGIEAGGSGETAAGTSDTKLAGLVGNGVTGLKRRGSTGGQMVDLDVVEGPGGLGREIASDTGIKSRRARVDSSSIQLDIDTRFQRKEAGGDPKINTAAVFAKGAFKGREKTKQGGGSPSTEPAIELGLTWLRKQQRAAGNWNLLVDDVPQEELDYQKFDSPTAATGLTLLAFQGAGYNHKEYKYANVVNKGVQWLVSNQKENGDLFVETTQFSNQVLRLYSHGIATIALCEAYGMTNDPELRDAAQRALDYIAESQDKTYGGWRYSPGRDSDTSVTGWMVMALKSGKLAGLNVDQRTLDLVNRWLEISADRDVGYRFRYNPNDKNTAEYPDREFKGKTPTFCMTSVGLLLRLYSGWDRTDERMQKGAAELLNQMPSEQSVMVRDTYYWYYATQVLRHVGGEPWEKWYDQSLYPLLIRTQNKGQSTKKLTRRRLGRRVAQSTSFGPMAGSWDPLYPVPDRWAATSGRLYLTTMNLLTLEVKWRLLPLYDETVK